MPSDPPDILRAVRSYADADKEPGMIGVQVAAGQHVLHHVLSDPCRRLALIKFCAGHMTGGRGRGTRET